MADLELFVVDKNDSSWSMRPWLLLVHFGIPFRETSFVAADPETPRRLLEVSPTGRVPALRVGARTVWESLAIVETLAELRPELPLWPRDPGRRMHARAVAAEMHAGFSELRSGCTMNLALETRVALDPPRRRELDRFERMVEAARADAEAGPFLFGAFSAADAMLAPVATRILSYGLEVGPITRAWVDAIRALPATERWYREAAEERASRPAASRIGAPLGGPIEERIPDAPTFAVIFTSELSGRPEGYGETAARMVALAERAPGYLGHESAREGSVGITVSHWASLEAIAAFRADLEHQEAQRTGRERFYARYDLRVARVLRRAVFVRSDP